MPRTENELSLTIAIMLVERMARRKRTLAGVERLTTGSREVGAMHSAEAEAIEVVLAAARRTVDDGK